MMEKNSIFVVQVVDGPLKTIQNSLFQNNLEIWIRFGHNDLK
jgi:hypothetical protein